MQILQGNLAEMGIDSRAGESVWPVDSFPEYDTLMTDEVGNLYCAAGGQELCNVSEKRPQLRTNGIHTQMAFQPTTHFRKPLAAASRITAIGDRIVFGGPDSISCIENKETGVKIPVRIETVYM